jgi:hypothetical protein
VVFVGAGTLPATVCHSLHTGPMIQQRHDPSLSAGVVRRALRVMCSLPRPGGPTFCTWPLAAGKARRRTSSYARLYVSSHGASGCRLRAPRRAAGAELLRHMLLIHDSCYVQPGLRQLMGTGPQGTAGRVLCRMCLKGLSN